MMNVHAKLNDLVRVLRSLPYYERDVTDAQTHLNELSGLLRELPLDDASIIGAEAQAIAHELCGEISEALIWRQREIYLMENLHEDVKNHEYDKATRRAILYERDDVALRQRKEMVDFLRQRILRES